VRRWLLLTAAVVVCAGPAAASGGPPPGATARCRDGTYSVSTHRSGTCSHHGGVARWLTGGGSSSTSTPSSGLSHVATGPTVVVGRRTRTSGCRLGALPDRRCSPGAYYRGLAKAVLCSSSFHTGSIRNVSESEKHAVEVEYGMTPASYGRTLEVDHIVPLEIGGSNAAANLFPEKANADPGYHVKDVLENRLHDLVCAGSMSLRAAQIGIARNWEALYERVFGKTP
jgi:hypothetical protein